MSSYMSQYMYNNNEVRDIQQLDAINPWSPLSLYLSLSLFNKGTHTHAHTERHIPEGSQLEVEIKLCSLST